MVKRSSFVVRVDVVDLVAVVFLAVAVLLAIRLGEDGIVRTLAEVIGAIVVGRMGVGVGKRAARYELGRGPKDDEGDDDEPRGGWVSDVAGGSRSLPPRTSREQAPTSFVRSLVTVAAHQPRHATAAVAVAVAALAVLATGAAPLIAST